jgi:hypothetical protein
MFKDFAVAFVVGVVTIGLFFWVAFGSHILERAGGEVVDEDNEVRLTVIVEDDYGEQLVGARVTLSTVTGTKAEGFTNKDGAVRLFAEAPRDRVILTIEHEGREQTLYGSEIWDRAQRRLTHGIVTITLRRADRKLGD